MSLCALGVEGGPTQGGRQRLGRGTVQVGYRGVLGLLLRRYRQEGDASLPASRDYVRIQKYRTYNSRATASAGEGLVLCYVAWVGVGVCVGVRIVRSTASIATRDRCTSCESESKTSSLGERRYEADIVFPEEHSFARYSITKRFSFTYISIHQQI
jgi:hypothetical protein